MRIECAPHWLEVKIKEISPARRDIHVEVGASVDGFEGHARCWIEEEKIKSFTTSVRGLYQSFAGTAELNSMSPSEFSLALSPANHRGYMLVRVLVV